MAIKKKTKIVKSYLPSIVLIGPGTNLVYQLINTKPMKKKEVETFDMQIQKDIASGKFQFSLAYKAV